MPNESSLNRPPIRQFGEAEEAAFFSRKPATEPAEVVAPIKPAPNPNSEVRMGLRVDAEPGQAAVKIEKITGGELENRLKAEELELRRAIGEIATDTDDVEGEDITPKPIQGASAGSSLDA